MNPYETAARLEKAGAIVDLFRAHRITSELARIMTPAQWKIAADEAGVNPPSDATIKQVVARLEFAESYAASTSADPFKALRKRQTAGAA